MGGSSESPIESKKSNSKTPRKPKETVLKQKSPAEFFAENKNIAGFDNPGKSLYTTVRELVENALDSAESISELPVVEITIEEIIRSKFNSMIGLVDRERIDAALYDDFETVKAREKRLAKEARAQELQAKNASLGKKVKDTPASKGFKGRGEASFYRVTCKDNGKGMPHDDIPNMFGRVLSGTKYGLKQTRGKFGLGAKMALIWSKMSTGLPIEISSSMKKQNYTSFCRLDIDIHKNIPHIHLHEKRENGQHWHGAEIQVVIEGNWTTYRSKILHYMRQMAVITPYAQFQFKFVTDAPDKNVTVRFARRTDVMPPIPLETKHHPSSVDLLLIKRLITETSKQNLLQFLQHEFVNISKPHAERLIGEMGPDFSSKMAVKSLTSQQLVRIHQLFRQAKFDDPSGHCLSPAGEYNLRLGIIKELHPDMVATYSGSAQVFEGHPFIVEAGISIGGKDVKQISPGVWFIGLFNGIGPTRTQSKMIIRGPAYSFAANITVEACTNSMMMGDFCNSPVYPFSCTTSNVNSTLKATTVNETMLENLMTCKSSLKTFCADESVSYIFSFDIINVADEFTIMASDVKFNVTPSNKTSGANDVSLMCFVRHGSMPSVASFDYSSDLSKVPLVIHSPLIGRWYITIVPINPIKIQDSNVRVCYSVESHVLQCPLGKAGPNCTMDIYTLQTFVRRGPTPFESYYLPVSAGASYTSANFPLEPLLSNSSYNGEPGNIWTYLLLDIPRGAAGGNIHVQLSSDVKINYEVYIRFGGLPSLINRDYHYVNKSIKSDTSMFFMLYDSSDDKINFYIMYAREGTWGFGLRYLNTSHDPSKGPTVMSLSLERCPKRCSSHGDCKFSFDASGLTSYSFCSCDRNHGGIDCSIEIVSHQGHIRQSFFLIVSNAAAILPAYWALRQKALAEWVLFTSSGIASGLYHACDVGAWCALNFNVLQFMDFWLSFMAVISTFLYLATIDEVLKRAIHTAVAILTALMAVTNATRSSNVVLVMVIGALGLLIGWVIELSTKYRSLSFSVRFSLDFSQILQVIKRWICNLIGTLLRRYHWPFALAGFSALSLAILSRTLETSENYWFWHSFWHISIYTSSFFFLCSKANIVDSESQLPENGNYELTHQDSLPRAG